MGFNGKWYNYASEVKLRVHAITTFLAVFAFECGAAIQYMENGRYKVGVDLGRGGLLCHFEDKFGGGGNLIHANGVQPVFRGNGYTAVINAGAATAQSLSADGLTLAVADEGVVVNAEKGVKMKAAVHLQYELHDDYLAVLFDFTDGTGQANGASDHELPAFYVSGRLTRFSCYTGSSGWTGEEVSVWNSPGYWGGNPDAYKAVPSGETWCAWTDSASGRGIGVYSPSASTILMGRTQDGSCSYAAPLKRCAIVSGQGLGFVYYVAAGTVAGMRDTFAAIRFALTDGRGLGKAGVRIGGKFSVVAIDPSEGTLSFGGRFVSLNGVRDSDEFAIVCRRELVDATTEFRVPVRLSVGASGENELAAARMALEEPPPSLFVLGIAERPSSFQERLVEKGFPADYAAGLDALHARHPAWEFEPQFVSDMTWDAVIDKEMYPARNLVAYSSWAAGSWISLGTANYTPYYAENAQAYDSGSFYQASRAAVEYFMDPRNFMNDTEIFMFETLGFNAELHTQAAIERALAGSFMANANYDGGSHRFSELLLEIGTEIGLSPVFLAGRVKDEQGAGTVQAKGMIGDSLRELYEDADGRVGSSVIWGTNYKKDSASTATVRDRGWSTYNGYYNFFNIGASGSGLFEIRYNAWKEAYEAPAAYDGPWTSQAKAVRGGSLKVKEKYIGTHRHTSYLQKFSVLAEAGSYRWSQYMQDISAPIKEARSAREAHVTVGALEARHVFLVPVYIGMPAAPCPDPANGNSVLSPTR